MASAPEIDVDVLLEDLERELAGTVLSVFQKAVARAGPSLRTDALSRVVAAIHNCATKALSPELRAYNANLATTSRLPAEVLCLIWENLPVEDRVKATHVCEDWRALALESPSLWSNLDLYSSVHWNEDCRCNQCMAIYEDGLECGRCGALCIQGRTNHAVVTHLLPRSGTLPISLSIEMKENASFDPSLPLAQSLDLHASRVSSLSAIIGSGALAGSLFDELPPLPSLVSLSCDIRPAESTEARMVQLMEAPNLKKIVFQGAPTSISCDSLHLEELQCAFNELDDISRALSSFPHLRSLRMDLSHYMPGQSSVDPEEVRSQLASLESVGAMKLTAMIHNDIWPVVANSQRQKLHLGYDTVLAGKLGTIVFGDLRDDIQLTMEGTSLNFQISATDSEGRRRIVECLSNPTVLRAAWDALQLDSLTSLTVNVPFLRDVLWTFRSMPRLQLLTLGLNDVTELQGFSQQFHAFHSLDTVHIIARYPGRTLHVEDVIKLVSRLKGGRGAQLDSLHLMGMELRGEPEVIVQHVRNLVQRKHVFHTVDT